MIDLSREVLQLMIGNYFIQQLYSAYSQQNASLVYSQSLKLALAFVDLDELLALDDHFSLSAWIDLARAKAGDAEERELFAANARNQLTLWGPDGNIIDYARKEW